MKKTNKLTVFKTLSALMVSLPLLSHAQPVADKVAPRTHHQQNKKQPSYFDDSVITTKVKNKLLTHKTDLKGLTVTTNNGVVSLTGFLSSETKKTLANQLASQVKGVRQVKNDIVVEKSNVTAHSYLNDSAITAKVKAKLLAESSISSSDVNVITKNGMVLLTGTVPNGTQLNKIQQVVQQTDDVKAVTNRLKISNN